MHGEINRRVQVSLDTSRGGIDKVIRRRRIRRERGEGKG